MFDSIVELITTNTWAFVIAMIICLMIVLFLIKRLFKLAIVAVFILLIYVGYLFFSGQKVPTNIDEIIEHGSEQLERHQIEDRFRRARESIKERIIDELFRFDNDGNKLEDKLKGEVSEII